jgi:flagellar biosynthetic protein FliR
MESFFLLMPTFLLILCRITAFFVVVPVFSSRAVPTTFKVGLAVFISFIAFATLGESNPIPMDALYILYIVREILIGVLLGFIAYLFFTVVQVAGSLMDIQIGFAIANIIDPMSGIAAPMIGNFKFMVAILLFLNFDGHHMFIKAIIESYHWLPLQNDLFARIGDGQVSDFMVRSFITMFTLAFQMSLPVLAAMFLTDMGLGLLTRVAPQFNIFVVGAPLKLIIGLAILMFLFPEFLSIFRDLFSTMFEHMVNLLKIVSGKNAPSP